MVTPVTYLTLGQAAKASGKSKGTLSKAIKSKKLSVAAKEGNSYKIDPAELFRVFPKEPLTETPTNVSIEQLETPVETFKIKELELELKHARELLRKEEQAHDETKADKLKWQQTAEINQHRLTYIEQKEEAQNNKKGLFSFLWKAD